jgi:hypothetical protein
MSSAGNPAFQGPDPSIVELAPKVRANPWNSNRTIALIVAVVHHGMANLAPSYQKTNGEWVSPLPAGVPKVLETATKFEEHLNTR